MGEAEMTWLDYTIYDKGSEPIARITFKPIPCLNKREVNELIYDLEQIWWELEAAGGKD